MSYCDSFKKWGHVSAIGGGGRRCLVDTEWIVSNHLCGELIKTIARWPIQYPIPRLIQGVHLNAFYLGCEVAEGVFGFY